MEEIRMKKHLGTLGLLMVAIIWGCGFVANNIALEDMTPLQILCFRFLIAAVLMGLFTIRKLRKADKKVLMAGALLGLFLFLGFSTQTFGLKFTTPSKNAFLTATNVVIVPFIAFVIYKKKVDRFGVYGAILAIAGIALLSLRGDLTLGFGDALTLACAFFFAFHIFFTGEFAKKYDVIALTSIQMIVAFLLSFTAMLITDGLHFQFSKAGGLSIIFLGVFSTTICFFGQTLAQKYTDETKAAVIMSMEAVFGTLFSILILREQITLRMISGSLLILVGVIVAETKLKGLLRRNREEVIDETA
jgi:drug/metabolite transporter (DMT)-like permease